MGQDLEHFEAYRTAKMMVRASVLTSSVLFLTCLGLISLLIALFPLKEIQPMLLTVKDRADQIVHIEPIQKSQKGFDLLMEKMARNYVLLRETIDLQTEDARFKELFYFSEDALIRDFYALMDPENPDSPYKKRLENKVTRSVQILSSASLAPSAPNVYQVEWASKDVQKGQVIGEEVWISTLTVECRESEQTFENQFLNPIGFTVTHYGVSKKGARK